MQPRKFSRKILLAGVSALAIGAGLSSMVLVIDVSPAMATTTIITTSTINGSIDGLVVSSVVSGGTLENQSTVDTSGIRIQANASLSLLLNKGLIAGSNGIDNLGTIASLTNQSSATITGTWAFYNESSGRIGTITNQGTISGSGAALYNNGGSIGSVINGGLITGGTTQNALFNASGGTITALTNNGTILGSQAVWNSASRMGTVTNNGLIQASDYAIANGGTINTIFNTGTLSGSSQAGIGNQVLVTSIVNTGVISSSGAYGLYNSGTIGAVSNSGTITGSLGAVYNSGGTMGGIANSGVIAGDILSTGGDLSIAGGSGGTVGTLTGYILGSQGTITAPNVSFTSGNLLLDDNITVGGGSGWVRSTATLQVNRLVTITGNYSQTSSGTLILGATSSGYGALLVSGTADLAGTVTIVAISSGALSTGEQLTIVSGGALTSSGVSADVGGFAETVTISGNTLIVTVGVSDGISAWQGRAAAADVSASVGTALEQLSSDPHYQTALTTLAALATNQQAHALQQVSGLPSGASVVVGGSNVFPVTNAVETHQSAMLAGGGIDVGKAAGGESRTTAVWGQILGGNATLDSASGMAGYSANSYGLLVGADLTISDHALAGAAINWLRSDSEGKGSGSGTSTTLDTYQITLYGGWRPEGGPFWLDGLVAAGLNRYDSSRQIDFLGETASADYDGQQYQARLTVGYDLAPMAGWTLTPLTSMQYVRVNTQGYTESGSLLAQSVDEFGFDAVEGELGARIARGFDTSLGRLDLDLKTTWVHSYTDSAIAVSAAIGGAGFTSTVERPAVDGVRIGLGATLLNDDGLSLRAEYDADLRADYASHTGLFKIRQEF